MTKTRKEEWKKPELIVLVRCQPEEAVLTVCKWIGWSTPTGNWADCWGRNTWDDCKGHASS
jgi:hypothetical protein